MELEQKVLYELRVKASAHLPADFARRIVEGPPRTRRLSEYHLIWATVLICACVVLFHHWIGKRSTDEANLHLWRMATAQIKSLENSI